MSARSDNDSDERIIMIPDWYQVKKMNSHPSNIYENKSDNNKKPIVAAIAVATTVTTAIVVCYAGYKLHCSIQNYGWEGTLRFIWEGDYYDPNLRESVNELEDAEHDLRSRGGTSIEERLSSLEESLDVASSKADNNDVFRFWNQEWMGHPGNANNNGAAALTIERTLADLSDRLDKIAARVDGTCIVSSSSPKDNNTFLTQRIKKRKKMLSGAIVSCMERCDALLASYQLLRERLNDEPKLS